MRALGWLITPVLLAGCFGNGMGVDDPPLTDLELHQMVERYDRETMSRGGTASGECTWTHDTDSLPSEHRCGVDGRIGFTVRYLVGAEDGPRHLTISTPYWRRECRVNGSVPGKRRLGCWFTARY